jgi:hypothetical protein
MTVITMSRTEIDRISVLQDLAASRIKVAAAALMSLGRRQVFRLAKTYSQQGPEALVSPPPRPAEQPLLPCGFAHCSHRHHPGALPGLRPDAGGREACMVGRGPRCTLLVYIDDATNRLMHLQFVESESTFDYFAATRRAYLER